MLSQFFKIFFRTSLKNRIYSFINVSGLAVGLAASILIFLWVIDETSFDRFHEDKDQIHLIMANAKMPDRTTTFPAAPGPLAPALKELPEVLETCRITDSGGRILFMSQDKSIYEEGVFADVSIFKVFTIPLLGGDALQPLPDNSSIAISKKVAVKYFGNDDPIGKVFRLDNKLDVKVSALFEDMPANSTLKFEFILPYQLYAKTDQFNQEWGAWTGGRTYVKLRRDASIESMNKKIHETFTKPRIWPRWDTNIDLFLYSLNDWRLRDNFENGKISGGKIAYVQGFAAVSVFILLIACINFMNLATARSVSRSLEVGVRKVVGADRLSLIGRFMAESILISLVSLLVSLLIVQLLLPTFNQLTQKQLAIDYTNPLFCVGLVGATIITGLMAGSYPAFFLSSLKAIQVLKGRMSGLTGGAIRKGLVAFQFSLSVILILSALVVYQQINYMRDKNLGFDKENAVCLTVNDNLRKNFDVFRNEALLNPSIKAVARSDFNPMAVDGGIVLSDNAWPGKTKDEDFIFQFLQCDENLLPALGFAFVDGRNFSLEAGSDSANYIITEEAARRMKLTNPVGQFLNGPRNGHIIGVIKDFHSRGLRVAITPTIIGFNPGKAKRIIVRYESGELEKAMAHIESVYRKTSPDFPMEYEFLDEPFGRLYENEILIGKLATCFTLIAIFISCLGLFGLSAFTAERRSKEISLRKVLGATLTQMVVLLCKDFVLVIGVALVVGLPVAWWGMQRFLETFQFRIEISILTFITTALLMLLIALLTVSYQSVKAALVNPATVLKSE